jgi:hypothetical protein
MPLLRYVGDQFRNSGKYTVNYMQKSPQYPFPYDRWDKQLRDADSMAAHMHEVGYSQKKKAGSWVGRFNPKSPKILIFCLSLTKSTRYFENSSEHCDHKIDKKIIYDLFSCIKII